MGGTHRRIAGRIGPTNHLIMINSSSEVGSELPSRNISQYETTPEPAHECDWCGKSVSHETASERPAGDTGEVVLLCAQCAYGID